MPISIFSNEKGRFYNITSNLGLDYSNGFWNTIEKADLNGDGYMDLLAGNLGENSFFKASKQKPLKMHINDFDQNGKIEQVISMFNGDKAFPVSQKKEITSQLPFLLKKYLKHHDYKEQTINDIFDYDADTGKYQVIHSNFKANRMIPGILDLTMTHGRDKKNPN